MSKKIGEYSEAHLLNVAKGVVEKKTADSVLLDTNAEGRIPKFKLEGTEILKYSVAASFARDPSCTHEYVFYLSFLRRAEFGTGVGPWRILCCQRGDEN